MMDGNFCHLIDDGTHKVGTNYPPQVRSRAEEMYKIAHACLVVTLTRLPSHIFDTDSKLTRFSISVFPGPFSGRHCHIRFARPTEWLAGAQRLLLFGRHAAPNNDVRACNVYTNKPKKHCHLHLALSLPHPMSGSTAALNHRGRILRQPQDAVSINPRAW